MSSNSSDSVKDLETVTLVGVTEDENTYEVLETCVVDENDYTHGLLEDEDSNIGSMVSIQSEEVVEHDGSDLIVPDMLEEQEIELNGGPAIEYIRTAEPKSNRPDSWPTLEILPGGVINHGDKNEASTVDGEEVAENEMVYACAKCPRRFKLLFCLVKHVKWHEDQAKKAGVFTNLNKLSPLERQFVEIKRERQAFEKQHKRQKLDVYSRIADSFTKLDKLSDLLK